MKQAPRSLRVLFQIRKMQEDQQRRALDATLAELAHLRIAMEVSQNRERAGRRLVAASILSQHLEDRFAGLEMSCSAHLLNGALATKIVIAEKRSEDAWSGLFNARVEREKAETLLERAQADADREAGKRIQQQLDDWYRERGVK